MTDHTDVVASVKADLERRGFILSGPCGAFQITLRVAWQLRAEGWGLVAKNPGQNGCTFSDLGRFAVDALIHLDGTTVDLLINSETENRPAWQTVTPAPLDSWRAPFNPDGDVPVPGPTPVPTPTPPPAPGPDVAELIRRVEFLEAGDRSFATLITSLQTKVAALEARKVPTGVAVSARIPFVGNVPISSKLTYPEDK